MCRHHLETLEVWLRRLIHDKLSKAYGDEYFSHKLGSVYIFRREIREHAEARRKAQPLQYERLIDALLLEHLVDTVCKRDLFTKHFKEALDTAFPDGNSEARTYFSRLVEIRNPLSHANPISFHQASRVFCYTSDIIESIKSHYRDIGMSEKFNAPSFVAFRDSLGHQASINKTVASLDYTETELHPGDEIRMEVEVDDVFADENWSIEWCIANIAGGERGKSEAFTIKLKPRHVGTKFTIQLILKSGKQWHRHSNHDARLVVSYTVLPPVEALT